MPDNNRPDFFVISPPKCGSTWLFENLNSHSEIFIPDIKEVKYFSNYFDIYDRHSYLSLFSTTTKKIKGDVSPSYAILPEIRIAHIQKLLPDLKIIIFLRNPVDRMWSHYKHHFTYKESIFAFRDNDNNLLDDKIFDGLTGSCIKVYTDYFSIINRWLKFFPKENLYIDFYDSIASKPQTLLTDIFSWLGVTTDIDWQTLPLFERINKGISRSIPNNINNFLITLTNKHTKKLIDFLETVFHLTAPDNWRLDPDLTKNINIDICDIYNNDYSQNLLTDVLINETMLSSHVQLISDNYHGFKIIFLRNLCYAIHNSIQDIDIVNIRNFDLEKLKKEAKIICCDKLQTTFEQIDSFTQNS